MKVIEINNKVKLSPRQFRRMQQMNKMQKKQYLATFQGIQFPIHLNKFERHFEINNKNRFISLQRSLYNNEDNMSHTPLTLSPKTQWIGVEIECYIDGVDFEENCDCGDMDCGSYGSNELLQDIKSDLVRNKISMCSVRSDGSLDGESGGVEFCLLFDANKGFNKLERLCKLLNSYGARVNTECGLHVHLDVRNHRADVDRIGNRIGLFLPILAELMPESRRENNEYCELQVSTTNRYSAINLTSVEKHGTIENRLHSGTTNFEKIRNWIQLNIALLNFGLKNVGYTISQLNMDNRFDSLSGLKDAINMDSALYDYYLKRYNKFNAINNDDETCGVENQAA